MFSIGKAKKNDVLLFAIKNEIYLHIKEKLTNP